MSKEILGTLKCFIFVPANSIEKDHAVFISLSWSSYQEELFTDPQKHTLLLSSKKEKVTNPPRKSPIQFSGNNLNM